MKVGISKPGCNPTFVFRASFFVPVVQTKRSLAGRSLRCTSPLPEVLLTKIDNAHRHLAARETKNSCRYGLGKGDMSSRRMTPPHFSLHHSACSLLHKKLIATTVGIPIFLPTMLKEEQDARKRLSRNGHFAHQQVVAC